MSLKIAIQMDPIDRIDINADSTFRIAEEAQARGHQLFYYRPENLSFQSGAIRAIGSPLTVQRVLGDHYKLGEQREIYMPNWDVVWMRQDPPFDMGYITNTHLLDKIHPNTLVVNDPTWVRNWPEKLKVLDYPDLTPPTTITSSLATLQAFKEAHGDVIVKPLYGNGGAGVFLLRREDRNLNSLHELFSEVNREPLIIQRFIPAVSEGDKRIILINGEPVGAINRVPAQGETRSNLHVGGRAEKVGLTDQDRQICARIGQDLRDHGQIFVGIDVIGGLLTEINVTSPTGIQELERFDGINVAGKLWDVIEAKRANRSKS